MAKHSILEYYKDDLKENWVRRAIAMAIDSALLGLIISVISFIPIVGLINSNPLSIMIGFMAESIMPTTSMVGMAPIWQAMIPYTVIVLIISAIYFTVLESDGRRTPGKMAMHLEISKGDNSYPKPTGALARNLTKLIPGAVGAFIFGYFGWVLFASIASMIDLKVGVDQKEDARQRLSEVSQGTWVGIEEDAVPFGTIALPEEERKKKAVKPESKPQSGKAPDLLPPRKEKEEEPKESLPPVKEKKEGEQVEEEITPDETPEKEEEMELEKEEKVPFWKRWFSKKEPIEEPPVEDVDTDKHVEDLPPVPRDPERDEIILHFMFDFDISEGRAKGIYEMGYRKREDLAEAIPRDLMMIEGVNPTVAKKIIQKAGEE